jgi:hypothetical protein
MMAMTTSRASVTKSPGRVELRPGVATVLAVAGIGRKGNGVARFALPE